LKILIVEDHDDIVTFYQDTLGQDHELTILKSLGEFEAYFNKKDFHSQDLFISDLKLPDGFFLDWIIKNQSEIMQKIPTIIVSSMDDFQTLKNCFEWGASDYLIKPLRIAELMVKVERNRSSYKLKSRPLTTDSIMEELTLIEAKIIQMFINFPKQHLSREEITSGVWKRVRVQPKTLDVHLSNLRKKLEDSDWSIELVNQKGWLLIRAWCALAGAPKLHST